jgi:hypothetical protein
MRIRDQDFFNTGSGIRIFLTLDPGSEMDKFGSGIRDKRPRSTNTEYHTAAHDSIKQIGMSQNTISSKCSVRTYQHVQTSPSFFLALLLLL